MKKEEDSIQKARKVYDQYIEEEFYQVLYRRCNYSREEWTRLVRALTEPYTVQIDGCSVELHHRNKSDYSFSPTCYQAFQDIVEGKAHSNTIKKAEIDSAVKKLCKEGDKNKPSAKKPNSSKEGNRKQKESSSKTPTTKMGADYYSVMNTLK